MEPELGDTGTQASDRLVTRARSTRPEWQSIFGVQEATNIHPSLLSLSAWHARIWSIDVWFLQAIGWIDPYGELHVLVAPENWQR